jgi:hypothetical protein
MTSKEIFEYKKDANPTFEDALNHPDFSHTRFDEPWDCFVGTDSPHRFGSLLVYFRCSDSPSGVLMAAGFHATPENKLTLSNRHLRANLGPSRGEIATRNFAGTIGF